MKSGDKGEEGEREVKRGERDREGRLKWIEKVEK